MKKMKNDLTCYLIIHNPLKDDNELRVFPDIAHKDLVGFKIISEGDEVNLSKGNCNSKSYFHIDKFGVGCLIDFLKRIYNDMEV